MDDKQLKGKDIGSLQANQAIRQLGWLGFWTFLLLLLGLILGLSARSEKMKTGFSDYYDQGSFIVQYWPVVY